MKNREAPPTHPKLSLRQKAEAQFRERDELSEEKLAALSHEEIRTILHELRVHQIELEMQNEELHRTQGDLDALRAHYFDLYDLAPVGYVTVSRAGLVIEANLTAATLLGVQRAALVEQPLPRFVFKEDADIFHLLINQPLETGSPTCDLRMVKSDGTTFWAHLKKVSALDENGVTQCRIVFTDISWRKEAEDLLREQETHLEAILEAAADGILAVDTKGKVIRANRRFAEIWRIPESIMKSGDDEILLGFVLNELSDPDGFLKKVQVLYDSDAESFDTFAFKDGRVIERYSFAMIMGGVRIGRVWSFRDVTERKALEASLTEALLHANASDAAKSEFLSVMSHELRSPLNGIIGFAELLENTALDAEQKSFVQTITKSGSHVLAVVNDVLDFSSMEAGALPIHVAPLELAELLEHSVAAAQKTAGDKGVAFRCDVAGDVPKQIVGDERRIRQILINLLGNAVKFTARGSVVLRVATDAERRFLNFSVEDTGIGISPESLGHLFNAFTQADSTINRQFGGSGLGLAISKRLAEAMGGTLTAESLPDKGSTFRVRLPLEIPTGMADAPSKGRFRV